MRDDGNDAIATWTVKLQGKMAFANAGAGKCRPAVAKQTSIQCIVRFLSRYDPTASRDNTSGAQRCAPFRSNNNNNNNFFYFVLSDINK
jgi:hypothetical protein